MVGVILLARTSSAAGGYRRGVLTILYYDNNSGDGGYYSVLTTIPIFNKLWALTNGQRGFFQFVPLTPYNTVYLVMSILLLSLLVKSRIVVICPY